MTDRSFTTSFTVDQTPANAFAAITDVRGWWSTDVTGGTATEGDEFHYDAGDKHRCTIRLTEVVPARKVTWHVLENYFDRVSDPEWTDTTITFDIAENDGRTEVRFTHHGLAPEFECYDACSNAWGFFVTASLRDLIVTGEGQPIGSRAKARH